MKKEILCDELIESISEICQQCGQTLEFENMLKNLIMNMANGTWDDNDLATLIEKVVMPDGC